MIIKFQVTKPIFKLPVHLSLVNSFLAFFIFHRQVFALVSKPQSYFDGEKKIKSKVLTNDYHNSGLLISFSLCISFVDSYQVFHFPLSNMCSRVHISKPQFSFAIMTDR